MRSETQAYPDYAATTEYIEEYGMTDELLNKIIKRHRRNAKYNKQLHDKYNAFKEGVEIAKRVPRYDNDPHAINNKLNHDFFGDGVDFVTGYLTGVPIAYGYADTEESKQETGGERGIDQAIKAITDFATRTNLYDVDLGTVKNILICGYTGRLLYIDTDGNERALNLPGYEVIVLSKISLMEPQYAIRYYPYVDVNGLKRWKAEFYDNKTVTYYEGTYGALKATGVVKPHMFDLCPLLAIPGNDEALGYFEKVMSLIDDYDKTASDYSNDLETFASAHMVFENIPADDETLEKATHSPVIEIHSTGTQPGNVYYLTKQIDSAAVTAHLDRLERNIYRFTHTPNLSDENMGDSSGQALKHRLLGLETKCGIIQAKLETAIFYMWRVLATAWDKKKIHVEPVQCTCAFKRNFPLDLINDVQGFQALLAANYPLKEAIEIALPWVDDADYIVSRMLEDADGIPDLDDIEDEDEALLNGGTAEDA